MAESKTSNEREENDIQVQWSELPSLPLEKIYSFLNRDDQVNMSLVCRKWSEGYETPSVWRNFNFALTKFQISLDSCPLLKFAHKYSHMFQHVEISYDFTHEKYWNTTWHGRLTEFLQVLASNSQLVSISFEYLKHFFYVMDSSSYDDISGSIANFLRSQHRLKQVEFHNCSFRYQESSEILKSLTENSGKSIVHLVLLNFVQCELSENQRQNWEVLQDMPSILSLSSLTTLIIDYSLIFENLVARESSVVKTLKNCCQPRSPLKVILFITKSIEVAGYRRLTSCLWRNLKRLYPNLRVELTYHNFEPSWAEVEYYIVPYMPITELVFCILPHSTLSPSSLVEIDSLIKHFLDCDINSHLNALHLKWRRPIPDLNSTFSAFVRACNKLKRLHILSSYPTNGVEDFLESLLENRPESFEEFSLKISGIDDENAYRRLKTLAAKYTDRFKLSKLTFKFSCTTDNIRRLIWNTPFLRQ